MPAADTDSGAASSQGAQEAVGTPPTPSKPSKKSKGAVKDISFKKLVDATGNRVALFYFASDGLHDKVRCVS